MSANNFAERNRNAEWWRAYKNALSGRLLPTKNPPMIVVGGSVAGTPTACPAASAGIVPHAMRRRLRVAAKSGSLSRHVSRRELGGIRTEVRKWRIDSGIGEGIWVCALKCDRKIVVGVLGCYASIEIRTRVWRRTQTTYIATIVHI
jgi:hypothetical protein